MVKEKQYVLFTLPVDVAILTLLLINRWNWLCFISNERNKKRKKNKKQSGQTGRNLSRGVLLMYKTS